MSTSGMHRRPFEGRHLVFVIRDTEKHEFKITSMLCPEINFINTLKNIDICMRLTFEQPSPAK